MNSYSADKDSSLEIGVLIELAKDWHIYWLNPGDSGIPTSIDWNIPKGFQYTEEHWPIPEAFEYEGLVSYGYANQALFIIEILLPEIDNTQILNISANIKSLLCKDICIPFDTTVNFKIDLHKDYFADETVNEIFTKIKKSLPIRSDNKGSISRDDLR